MADSDFKSKPISFPQGWVSHTAGSVIGEYQYKPDRSFKDNEGKIVCVIESSSTNDRKTGVGELCLADKFFADSQISGTLIFSLCGKAKYPPNPSSQAKYLQPYFSHLKLMSLPFGLRDVYIIAEDDFENLGWVALSAGFLAKATSLKP